MRFPICFATCVTALVVAAAPALPQSPDAMYRCDGAGLTPCDIVLPEHDIALTLLPGYGLTEPFTYRTPSDAMAARPSFDIVRLVDGETVVMVNARQAQAVYCQDGLAGDTMCVTDAVTDADGVGVAFVLASLGSVAMAFRPEALIADDPGGLPGDLQGVWFGRLDMPGLPDDEAPFLMMELFQDAGDPEVFGYFVTAPDLGPLRAAKGDVTGRQEDDRLVLTLAASDGTPLLGFAGVAGGDSAYSGDIAPEGSDAVAAHLSRVAGPGEDWSGPAWMTSEAAGADTGGLPGQTMFDDTRPDPETEEQAMAALLGALIGTVTSADVDQTRSQPPQSPTLAPLGGRAVDLQGLSAAPLVDLILPFREGAP